MGSRRVGVMTVRGALLPDPDNPRRRHLRGQSWDKAPLPARAHRCRTQTLELGVDLIWAHRCACGAQRVSDGHMWVSKNSRRR